MRIRGKYVSPLATTLLASPMIASAQPEAASAASQASAAANAIVASTGNTLWLLVVIAAIAVGLLIFGLTQPSNAKIEYTADSFFQVRKLFFAAGVLGVLAFILLLSISVYVALSSSSKEVGKEIFDSMIKVIPPIMTLVLGYYFGQQSVVRSDAAGGSSGSGGGTGSGTGAAGGGGGRGGNPSSTAQVPAPISPHVAPNPAGQVPNANASQNAGASPGTNPTKS